MKDFKIKKGVLHEYRGNASHVVIPVGVTIIGIDAFFASESLVSVKIPPSVTKIGEGAFRYCANLQHVLLPDSLTDIQDAAFACCDRLSEIIIPEHVKYIHENAFGECSALKSVSIPDTVIYIGSYAFDDTAWFKAYPDDFVIAGNQILIGYKGNAENVIIPDGVKSIADWAFHDKPHIKSVVIPESVTDIGAWAFDECDAMKQKPLIMTENKILFNHFTYQETEETMFYHIEAMVLQKDYSADIFPAEFKYDLLFQMFAYDIDRKGLWKYFLETAGQTLFACIIRENTEMFHKFLHSGEFVTEKNIDSLIGTANHAQSYEIQVMLMNYKNKHFGYEDTEAYIRKKFEL